MPADPHINPQTGVWDDNYYNSTGKYGSLIGDIGRLAQSNPTLKGVIDSDNAYIDQLIGEAQGDLNLMLKKLDAEHKLALGSDDGARADFLERVADKLEERIGRIPYDYERYTSRELESYARESGRVVSDKTTALKRLDEDEKVLRENARLEADQERELQGAELNERGILSSTRENATGLAGKNVRTLEGAINRKEQEITRAVGRDRFDISQGANRSLEDLLTGHTQTLEDIKTDARRGAIDQEQATSFGKESAQREFENRKTALERERKRLMAQAPSSAAYINAMKGGYG